MNEINNSEYILKELEDMLENSLAVDQDPLIIEAQKKIVDIARGCKIDLDGNLTDDNINTLWNEYLKRSKPQCLGIEETVVKDTKYIIFMVGLYEIWGGQNSMQILEHVLALAKIAFSTAIALSVLDIFKKNITKRKKKKGYK